MATPEVLTTEQLHDAVARLTQWEHIGDTLVRSVEMPTFPAAIDLVVHVGEAAEAADHHPDIDIRWRTVTFTLSTHSAGGITELDVDLATVIDGHATPQK